MYALLVRSINTLLKRRITNEDIIRSEYDLLQFVGNFQVAFSKSTITSNIYSLLHLGESVKQSRPLLDISAFAFENGIFGQKQCINGPRGVSHQIVKKFLKKKMLISRLKTTAISENSKTFCENLFKPRQLLNYLKLQSGVVLTAETRVKKNINDEMKFHFKNNNLSPRVFKKGIF